MWKRSTRLRLAGLAAGAFASGCGLLNGLQGNSSQPDSSSPPLTTLSWHGPEMIDQGLPINSSAPVLAWGQGAAWLAFESVPYSANPPTAISWVTRRPRGGSFAAPIQLPAIATWNGGAIYPQIAIGETGDAVVAVDQLMLNASNQITEESVWATRIASDLTLDGAGLVRVDQNNAVEDNTLVSLVADEAGNAIVLYTLSGNGTGGWARTQSPGAAWSNPVGLDTNFDSGYSLSAGSAGTGLLSEVDDASTGSEFLYAARAAPITFSGTTISPGPELSFPDAGSGQYLLTAMRGEQGMVVAAREGGDSFTTDALSGAFWGGMQTFTDTHVTDYVEPFVTVNSKGAALLLWQDYVVPNTDGYAGNLQASFWDGGSWSPPQELSLPSPSPHAWWAVADLNDQGEAVAAWADFESTGTYTRIFADVLETSSGAPVWSGALPIDLSSPDAGLANNPANVRYVGVALDPNGGAAQVVWIGYQTSDTTVPRVWSNYLETP